LEVTLQGCDTVEEMIEIARLLQAAKRALSPAHYK